MNIENYILIAQSLVKLMHPLVEVVIHDLNSGKIVFIEGELSTRRVGDPSLLETNIQDWQAEINQEIYPKIGFDGRLMKSISIPINEKSRTTFMNIKTMSIPVEEKSKTPFLMCINCDVSIFKDMKGLADVFFKGMDNQQPVCLFKNDYQERMHEFLHQILKDKGWRLDTLGIKEKREIVKLLFEQGAFNEKNAADYIANLLDMGRATIFNYLKEWRIKNES